MCAKFEVLPGLPPYGPVAESFTATGQGTHREGFVVRFETDDGQSWVGNFQRGSSRFETVIDHPSGREVIVIAGGQGYVVNPEDRSQRTYWASNIEEVIRVADTGLLLVSNGLWFEAIERGGTVWRTRRISWDGLQDVRLEGNRLRGQSWSPIDDCWAPFEVDIETGSVRGGSYEGREPD